MKVIHVSAVGGTALTLLEPQCRFLKDQGFDVHFSFSRGPRASILRNQGYPVHEVHISRLFSPISDLFSIIRLALLFRKEKPNIVHTHTSKGGGVGRIAAFFAGVPIIIHTIHGFPFHEGSSWIKRRLYILLEKSFAKVTDLLLSQSREDIHTARELGIGSKSGAPVYIGNGIDTSRFIRNTYLGERERVRKELGISNETLVIITVGRLTKEKGYYELLKALSSLKNKKWVVVCAGADDGYEIDLRNKVSQYGLNDRVCFLGNRDDIPELLSASDIFVLASHREGVPRSVIEAQAMGLPAIVTDIRGCREIVVDGETGIIVKLGCPDSLATAIDKLIDDEQLRIKMGLASSKVIRQEFDESIVFDRILKAYCSIINEKSGTKAM